MNYVIADNIEAWMLVDGYDNYELIIRPANRKCAIEWYLARCWASLLSCAPTWPANAQATQDLNAA